MRLHLTGDPRLDRLIRKWAGPEPELPPDHKMLAAGDRDDESELVMLRDAGVPEELELDDDEQDDTDPDAAMRRALREGA